MYIDEKFINERISYLRNRKGVSARDMSLTMGQNENYVNRIETGIMTPSLNGLVLICEYFNISLSELFDVGNKNPMIINQLIKEIKELSDESIINLTNFVKTIKKDKK